MFKYKRLKKHIEKLQNEKSFLLRENNNLYLNINHLQSLNDDLKKDNNVLEYQLKESKNETRFITEACEDYVVIPIDKYEEIRDLYQKLSETEEQRKNMSQAYEDEYQTRLALQEENERLKNLIKRNLNRYRYMH